MQENTVFTMEFSCCESDNVHACQSTMIYSTDSLSELENHSSTSACRIKVTQKWFEGFQAFCCTLDLGV